MRNIRPIIALLCLTLTCALTLSVLGVGCERPPQPDPAPMLMAALTAPPPSPPPLSAAVRGRLASMGEALRCSLTAGALGAQAHSQPAQADAWTLIDAIDRDQRATIDLTDAAIQGQANWFERAQRLANTTALPEHLEAAGYRLPGRTHLLLARIEEGVGQPRLVHLSLGHTGFLSGRRRFFPASAIKIAAAVGALWSLSEQGFTHHARVALRDRDGRYTGSVDRLLRRALLNSDNPSYNRLVEIAGLDPLNRRFFSPAWGLPLLSIQIRYGRAKGMPLDLSPYIYIEEDERVMERPRQEWGYVSPLCKGNCTSLFELQEILRRVMFHRELPEAARFPLADDAADRLKYLLRSAPSHMTRPLEERFGHAVEVFNNYGNMPGRHMVDNALILDPQTGARFMLAIALPYARRGRLRAVLNHTIDALQALDVTREPGLQHDSGLPLRLDLRRATTGVTRATLDVPGAWRVNVWVDREPVAVAAPLIGGGLELELGDLSRGALLVVRAEDATGHEVSYRAVWVPARL